MGSHGFQLLLVYIHGRIRVFKDLMEAVIVDGM